jgi:hypothetical protein
MAKPKKSNIDTVIKDLYNKAVDFNDKLAVLKEWNKLEIARLKGDNGPGDDVPEGLKD